MQSGQAIAELLPAIYQWILKINYFISGRSGSSLLRAGFLPLQRARAALHGGAQASDASGFSLCRARALGLAGLVVWRIGLVALRHVGSSWTGG